jgi:uncharacterized cupredoxin-like copper-binding protein
MLRHLEHRLRVVLVPLAAALLIVTGCGTGGTSGTAATSSGTATQPSPTGSATSTAGTGSPTAGSPTTGATVTATLSEFKIELSATAFSPGRYTFVAEQKGQRTHALSIRGPGIGTKTTPVIEPGGASQRLIVTLQPGTYELWCPIDHHREQGMTVTITVG